MTIRKTYRARAIDAEFGFTKNNNEEIVVRFQLLDGGDHAGSLPWYGYFNTKENAERAIAALRCCGWQGDDLTELEGIDANEVELTVEDEVYEGKPRTKVAWVNEIGGGTRALLARKMDEGQRAAFARRMKGLAASIKPKAPKDYPADWDK